MVPTPPPGPSALPFACRVLPHLVADGATQMALDEALLDCAAEDGAGVAVRTYEWSIPTLSLGYFQPFDMVATDQRWLDVPIVRRASGGGALWHHREITYAVVVPRSHPLAHPSSALYRAVHEAIADQLRRLGWSAGRREMLESKGEQLSTPSNLSRPFLCFRDQDSQDVVIGGAKIVGSAQRRRAGAVLQHGSVLLGRSPTTPELPGLADLGQSGNSSGFDANHLIAMLVATLGDSVFAQGWTETEQRQAETLRRERYSDRGWTERR